jgi:hypothetical protein
MIKTLGLVTLIALGGAELGCSTTAAAQPASDTPVSANTNEAKISAPVQVTLTSSAKSGTVVVTLSVQPKTDIPRGVARIVVPAGVKLVSGQAQMDLGPLKSGVAAQHQVTLEVPSTGQFQIFAGVDCHISSGIRLHKAAEALVLGQSSPAQAPASL